jgi:hypothetical protein
MVSKIQKTNKKVKMSEKNADAAGFEPKLRQNLSTSTQNCNFCVLLTH